MKVSLSAVICGHIKTLRNLGDNKVSRLDLSIFYLLPAALGLLCWYTCVEVSTDVYLASISVFAIFSALLFSVQVAMYGVFRTDRRNSNDVVLGRDEKTNAENTQLLLREINANVSYLIFFSGLAVTTFLIFLAAPIPDAVEAGTLIGLYVHFILTVAMVLKRAHEVFDAEYAKPLPSDRKS